ncbi:Hypothetical predicted protein [Mytilus galloprovincialis]|uniref:Methyltransferase FkbM domain-containing protein n=1 Tax=Mytilus galloprovincialis TaxID=29158 RepID=A0A8B6DE49_MYTGA|nr:Hypothetical predicted protein [Mytilus galloprovincialis]
MGSVQYQYAIIWFALGVTLIVPLLIMYNVNVDKTKPVDNSNIVLLSSEETLGKIITRENNLGWSILDEETCQAKDNFVLKKILPLNVPIYIYDPNEDVHISRMIFNSGTWETPLVDKVVEAMKLHPDAVFIDIGANIGMYSMTMAALGYRVIAIDCNIENVMRLCASARKANVTNKMSIIHNGISDKRSVLRLIKSTEPNVGGMGVEQISSTSNITHNLTANAILLDDLLEIFPIKSAIIKMDVEKHEDEILKGAKVFFEKVKVETVLLEFRFHAKDKTGKFIIDFFDKHGLAPDLSKLVNASDYSTWPGDLIWSRKK